MLVFFFVIGNVRIEKMTCHAMRAQPTAKHTTDKIDSFSLFTTTNKTKAYWN